MKKYSIRMIRELCASIEIEADGEEMARDIAIEEMNRRMKNRQWVASEVFESEWSVDDIEETK